MASAWTIASFRAFYYYYDYYYYYYYYYDDDDYYYYYYYKYCPFTTYYFLFLRAIAGSVTIVR